MKNHIKKTDLVRKLRKKATPAERKLWSILRNRQLRGFKFYRQFPIGSFITDFCCRSKKLVIEIDGSVHIGREIHDQNRAEFLNGRGYKVIRFNNDQVINDINQVAEVIIDAIMENNNQM